MPIEFICGVVIGSVFTIVFEILLRVILSKGGKHGVK